MNINQDNYQAFLLDLSEGTLSKKETEILYAFLDKHPELDADLSVTNTFLPAEHIAFENKEQLLYDSITPSNRLFFFIGHIENQLSAEEEKQLTQFLKVYPVYEKEFQTYTKTILPKEKEIYPYKKELIGFTKTPVSNVLFKLASAAAIVLFVWLGTPFFNSTTKVARYERQTQVLTVNKVDAPKIAVQENKSATSIKKNKQEASSVNRPTNKGKNTAVKTQETENVSPEKELQHNQLHAAKSTRVAAQQLETVIASLTPKTEVPFLEPLITKDIVKAPLSVKEYLVAKVEKNTFITKTPKKQEELFQLLNKQLNTMMGADQYIAKKEEDKIKTHISFGRFSFYKSKTVNP